MDLEGKRSEMARHMGGPGGCCHLDLPTLAALAADLALVSRTESRIGATCRVRGLDPRYVVRAVSFGELFLRLTRILSNVPGPVFSVSPSIISKRPINHTPQSSHSP